MGEFFLDFFGFYICEARYRAEAMPSRSGERRLQQLKAATIGLDGVGRPEATRKVRFHLAYRKQTLSRSWQRAACL